MNIEKSIDNVRFIIGDLKASNYNQTFIVAIETLLTDYEKEKEKNKELDKENQGLFELYNFNDSTLLAKILKDYKKIIEKQKEKIEKLKYDKKFYQEVIDEVNETWENKIKAKEIEIKNRPVKDEFITATQGKLNTIIEIESLLEKE